MYYVAIGDSFTEGVGDELPDGTVRGWADLVAAGLVQMAVSRSREFQADASGSQLSQDPLALASALRKLEAGVAVRPLPQEERLVAQSHLMIANPFRGQGLATMFATHPPMPQRIARLEEMARDLGQL